MTKLKKMTFFGIVISDKMNKTVIVKSERRKKHVKYKKILKCFTKFFVHDENNECKIGDKIIFKETSPISKKKNWVLCSIIGKVKK